MGLIAVLAIAVVFVLPALGIKIGAGTEILPGYKVLSISSTTITSNDPDWNGVDVWLVDTLQGQGNDILWGLKKNEGELNYSTFKSGAGVEIEFERTREQTCKYLLQANTAPEVISYGRTAAPFDRGYWPIENPWPNGASSAETWCLTYGQNTVVKKYTGSNIYYCYEVRPDFQVGYLGSQGYDWEYIAKVKNLKTGILAQATINPQTTLADLMVSGSAVGKVDWTSNSLGNVLCPTINHELPLRQIQSGLWNIGEDVSLGNYRTAKTTVLTQLAGTTTSREQDLTAIGAMNTEYGRVTQPITTGAFRNKATNQPNAPIYLSYDASGAALAQSFFPHLRLLIKTSFIPKIAIGQNVGTPFIVNKFSELSVTYGQTTSIYVVVKNNHETASDAFTVSALCTNPTFQTSGAVQTNVLAPNAQQGVTVQFSANAQIPIDASCTVKACSVNSASTCDQFTTVVHGIPNCYPLTCGIHTTQQPDCTCKCDLTSCPPGQTLITTATTCFCQSVSVCGDGICQANENILTCFSDCNNPSKCADGTNWGSCATQKPYKCVNGNLVPRAQECGCSAGLQPQADGTCGGASCPQGWTLCSDNVCREKCGEGGCPAGQHQCMLGSCGTDSDCNNQIVGILVILGALAAVGGIIYLMKGQE